MDNEEYRRNRHSAAAGGTSGVLDTGLAGTGQPRKLQIAVARERDRLTPYGTFRMPGCKPAPNSQVFEQDHLKSITIPVAIENPRLTPAFP